MKKLPLILGLVLYSIGNNALANNAFEVQAADKTSSAMQAHCSHWSADLLLAATDPTLPDFLQNQPHCLQKINAWKMKAQLSHRDFDQMFARFDEVFLSLPNTSDKVAFTLGFVDEVSKVHPVSLGPKLNDLPYSLRFVEKSHADGNAHRRMDLTTIKPSKYRLTDDEFRQFASTAVRSKSISEKVLYVINGKKKLVNGIHLTTKVKNPSESEEEDDRDSFKDWAWDQAEATCEMMGCEKEWAHDYDTDEDYILFWYEDENGDPTDFWEGYHHPAD